MPFNVGAEDCPAGASSPDIYPLLIDGTGSPGNSADETWVWLTLVGCGTDLPYDYRDLLPAPYLDAEVTGADSVGFVLPGPVIPPTTSLSVTSATYVFPSSEISSVAFTALTATEAQSLGVTGGVQVTIQLRVPAAGITISPGEELYDVLIRSS